MAFSSNFRHLQLLTTIKSQLWLAFTMIGAYMTIQDRYTNKKVANFFILLLV